MQQSIEVITVHNEDGSIRPFRFRMKDDVGEELVLQVRKIVDKREEKITGVNYKTFYCLCSVNDMNRTFVIRFRQDTCRWFLMKII